MMDESDAAKAAAKWAGRASSGMSFDDVREYRAAVLAATTAADGSLALITSYPGPTRQPYSAREVLDEIQVVLQDIARLYEDGNDGDRLPVLVANQIAVIRDLGRPRTETWPLGKLAGFLAAWLLDRARADRDGAPSRQLLACASAAAGGDGAQIELGQELREFVGGVVSGEIDDDDFLRRLQRARKVTRNHAATTPMPVSEEARRLKDAALVLVALLAARPQSFRGAWDAFSEFAKLAFFAETPERISLQNGDLLLFERAYQRGGHAVSFVRQFEVEDGDGSTRLEQIRCSVTATGPDRPDDRQTKIIWSGEDFTEWFFRVEEDPIFLMLSEADALVAVTVDADTV